MQVDEIQFGAKPVAPKVPTRARISGDEECYVLGWKYMVSEEKQAGGV